MILSLLNSFIFEFLYSVNRAKHEVDSPLFDENMNITALVIPQKETYETFNFNVGYKFAFGSDIQANTKDAKIKKLKKPAGKMNKKRKKITDRAKVIDERKLLIEQNELLKKQIELLQQKNN